MEIVLSEAQQMLQRSARQFLRQQCPPSLVHAVEQDPRGYSPELWQQMASLGWLGMLFPEEYGGSPAPFTDVALVVEEMGYAALPGPFFSTVVLSGLLLMEAGSQAQKRGLLPQVARGELFIAPVLPYEGSPGVSALPQGSGYLLQGSTPFVPDAGIARHLLCAAATDQGLSLFLVDTPHPGIELTPLLTTAGDRQFEVAFHQVAVSPEQLVGEANQAGEPLRRAAVKATVLKAAEMVGVAQAALDLSVEYVSQREQFGRPIGSFQAVHHHLADMFRDVQMCRLLSYQAAWRLEQGLPAEREAALARIKVGTACPQVTSLAHQVHGGVGFYTRYPLELYYRRALAGAVFLGSPGHFREQASRLLSPPAHYEEDG